MGFATTTTRAALSAVARLMEADDWERVKEYLRRGDRQGAIAEVNRVLDEIKFNKMIEAADTQARKDVIFQVLDLAELDERPVLSTVLGIRSAEAVGNNLARATQDLTQVTQTSGESVSAATTILAQVTETAGTNLSAATANLAQVTETVGDKLLIVTQVLVGATIALFLATVALVIVTALA